MNEGPSNKRPGDIVTITIGGIICTGGFHQEENVHQVLLHLLKRRGKLMEKSPWVYMV